VDHVYRRFTQDDLFHTTINAHPLVIVESGSTGWVSNIQPIQPALVGTNAVSLYGDVRSRADVYSGSVAGIEVYPLDRVDTHAIDHVINVPGTYPATGSINFVMMTNEEGVPGDTRWYDEHYAPINILSDWYHRNRYFHYPALDTLPMTCTLLHVPEMVYGRQIASGSVYIWTNAWKGPNGTYPVSGTRYFVDDGYGRLWDVPSGSTWQSGTAVVGNVFYNEGLIVFTTSSANWHAEFFSASFDAGTNPSSHFEFKGSTVMKSFVFMCRLPPAAANASNNPTYSAVTGSKMIAKYPTPTGESKTYITAIGLYNEERQLVAVAKMAQPIRKRESDNIDIRLRLDI
jgi:hypothetical protein